MRDEDFVLYFIYIYINIYIYIYIIFHYTLQPLQFEKFVVYYKLKIYFIGKNLQYSIRNGFNNVEFVQCASR